ncbi:MAG: MXAN_2561 family MXYO-CTERM-anchored protein [Myxococcaceae bacterium]
MRLLAVTFLLLAAPVFAQTVVLPQITFRAANDLTNDTFTFGTGNCNDTVTVRWTNTTTLSFITTCSASPVMKVWATTGECNTTPGTGDLRYDDIPGLTLQGVKQGSFDVKLANLPGFNASLTTDGGVVTCGTTGITSNHKICGDIEYTAFTGSFCSTTSTHTSASPLKMVYDTQPPGVPTMTDDPKPLDQGVRVDFSADSDTALVLLEVRAQGDADYRQIAEAVSTNKFVTGNNLVNNTTYDVRIRAQDKAGNTSDPTASASVTPIKTLGIYGFYRNAGGTDGGCATAPGLGAALALGFFLRRRHRRSGSTS